MASKHCKLEHLSSTSYGQVLFCRECGVVHLHLQNLSLRLNIETFLGISDTLSSAANALRRLNKKTSERMPLKLVN